MIATILSAEDRFGCLHIRVQYDYPDKAKESIVKSFDVARGDDLSKESMVAMIDKLIIDEGQRLLAVDAVAQESAELVGRQITIVAKAVDEGVRV